MNDLTALMKSIGNSLTKNWVILALIDRLGWSNGLKPPISAFWGKSQNQGAVAYTFEYDMGRLLGPIVAAPMIQLAATRQAFSCAIEKRFVKIFRSGIWFRSLQLLTYWNL